MAKKIRKIPIKFREVVEPILMKNEVIECTFRESFKWDFDWDTLFPRWLILTNYRLLIISRTMPGVRVEEFHIAGMNINLFRDNLGLYDSIEFRESEQLLYQASVYRKRRAEAEVFVREIAEAIARLDEGQKPDLVNNQQTTPEDLKKCSLDKRHLKDLERMGAITEEEYTEEEAKPCEK